MEEETKMVPIVIGALGSVSKFLKCFLCSRTFGSVNFYLLKRRLLHPESCRIFLRMEAVLSAVFFRR